MLHKLDHTYDRRAAHASIYTAAHSAARSRRYIHTHTFSQHYEFILLA
jgi:hypothetical protein